MRQALGQVHTVGAHPPGQAVILPDQQLQPAEAGDAAQLAGGRLGAGSAERAVDDARSQRDGGRVRRAGGVGEEQQRRRSLPQPAPGG
jgi:hypothetical protein